VGLARGFWKEILWDCYVENMQTSWEDIMNWSLRELMMKSGIER
jgi:hypothetical protein